MVTIRLRLASSGRKVRKQQSASELPLAIARATSERRPHHDDASSKTYRDEDGELHPPLRRRVVAITRERTHLGVDIDRVLSPQRGTAQASVCRRDPDREHQHEDREQHARGNHEHSDAPDHGRAETFMHAATQSSSHPRPTRLDAPLPSGREPHTDCPQAGDRTRMVGPASRDTGRPFGDAASAESGVTQVNPSGGGV